MVYVLESVRLTTCRAAAVRAQLRPGVFYMVEASGSALAARQIDPELGLRGSAGGRVPAPVLAMCAVAVAQKDGTETDHIVALTESSLYFVRLSKNRLRMYASCAFTHTKGHAAVSEIPPILLTCPSPAGCLLIVHAFSGFVSVFNVEHMLRGSRGKACPHKIHSIGAVVAVLMAIVSIREHGPGLAVLYRDIDFHYSLRVYSIPTLPDAAMTVLRQMELFSSAPSLVVSLRGSALVLGDANAWFFPLSAADFSVLDSETDVIYNRLRSIATIPVPLLAPNRIGARISCASVIDDLRVLYITDAGTTMMAYVAISGSANHTLRQAKIIELGPSTIAHSVVHLTDNWFYASSKTALPVLFRVLPTAPHIDIIQSLESLAPVLDIAQIDGPSGADLLVTRGGFKGSVVEKLAFQPYLLKLLELEEVGAETVFIEAVDPSKKSRGTSVLMKSGVCFKVSLHLPRLETKTQLDHGVIELIQDLGVSVQFTSSASGQKSTIQPIPGFDQIAATLHEITATDSRVHMTLWDGLYCCYSFSKSGVKEVTRMLTPLTESLSIAIHDLGKPLAIIILLDTKGSLYQISANGQNVLDLKLAGTRGDFVMCSDASTIVIYDECSLLSLHKRPDSHFLYPSHIHSFRHSVKQCVLVDSQNVDSSLQSKDDQSHLFVLFKAGISHYAIEKGSPLESCYASNALITRCIAMHGKHIVALLLTSKPNPKTGLMERLPTLLLLHAHTLELLHEYKPKAPINYSDICRFKHDQMSMIAACSDTSVVQMFRIKQNKIEPVDTSFRHQQTSSTFSPSRIASFDDRLFLTGDFNEVLRYRAQDNSWARMIVGEGAEGVYGVDVALGPYFSVYADAIRGLFSVEDFDKNPDILNPIRGKAIEATYTPCFVTCVAVLRSKPVLLFGDSVGNLCAMERGKSGSFTELFATNVGEQINCITIANDEPLVALVGTVTGLVLKIQDVALTKDDFEGDFEGMWRNLEADELTETLFGVYNALQVKKEKRSAMLANLYEYLWL